MLLRFGVANHRSMREYQEILFVASHSPDRLMFPVSVVDASVVPATVFVGANASGKSNLLDAMVEMEQLVVRSHKHYDETDRIRRSPFRLDPHSESSPTRFECSFTLETGTDEVPVYDLEIEFTDYEVCRERLRRTVRQERRSTHTLYTRQNENGKVHVEFGAQLQGANQITANLTRPNSLFLSAAAQNNHQQLTEIHRWFANDWKNLVSVGPISESSAAEAIADSQNRELLGKLLQQAETGVRGIDLIEREWDEGAIEFSRSVAQHLVDDLQVKDGPIPLKLADSLLDSPRRQLRLLHETAGDLLPLDYRSESLGTKMLLTLVLPAFDSLSKGSVLLIDEIDSSLHPRLVKAFVSLFLRPESNPKGAQLIFTTHDVTLLGTGLLSQNAIWMVDKDLEGVSTVNPLSDYKIRGDFERAYRDGRVGGSPELHGFFLDLTA
ncbi:MAG: ATP-binding protein [Gammaproteobacteria bacterium]|nr:ATP-binding protein [Gammaproteobacteria bacterium]MYD80952.1 ATP-binding protein [Gammaproteobacteria bacterium]